MNCPCGATPCRRLETPNAGASWLYAATRTMNTGEAMIFRARHAAPNETRSLVFMVAAANVVLLAQQPHLFAKAED